MLPAILLCTVAATAGAQRMEAGDLGLSVEWANMNVGADSPEDYGDYFAWGEVKSKRYYGMYSTYKHFDAVRFNKYNYMGYSGSVRDNLLTLESIDDAATKHLGQAWRMPTEDEMQELLEKCVFKPDVLNGTRGYWVCSTMAQGDGARGDSIFLPSAGYRDYGTYRFFPGTQSYYWTSTLLTADSLASVKADPKAANVVRTAKCLTYVSGTGAVGFMDRRVGCVIRPVRNRKGVR